MNDKIILSYHDAIIYQSDLKIIKSSTEWLNDRIITFYFEYLKREFFDDEQILLIGEIIILRTSSEFPGILQSFLANFRS